MRNENKKNMYLYGMGRGLAIGLGYLSVSFGFGITAVNMGLLPIETILIYIGRTACRRCDYCGRRKPPGNACFTAGHKHKILPYGIGLDSAA